MKVDLVGKIKNTQLPRSKALLPIVEPMVNSFQTIEERKKGQSTPRTEIFVEHDGILPGIESDGDVNGFTVTGNGVGINEDNWEKLNFHARLSLCGNRTTNGTSKAIKIEIL